MTTLETTHGFVKKETMLLIAISAFVGGFLCGVVFSVYKSGPATPQVPRQQTQAPAQQSGGLSAEAASHLLALERQVLAEPKNVQAWIEIGHINFDSNQFAKAITAYNKALALDPDNANVRTDLGVMLRRSGQPEAAIAAFDLANQSDPSHEPSLLNKAIVLMYDLHDDRAAIQAVEALLALNPAAMAPNGTPVTEMLKVFQQHLADAGPDH